LFALAVLPVSLLPFKLRLSFKAFKLVFSLLTNQFKIAVREIPGSWSFFENLVLGHTPYRSCKAEEELKDYM
jgi:hypothetical protein